MRIRPITTSVTEAQTQREIRSEFRKWDDDAQRDGEGEIITAYDFPPPKEIGGKDALCRVTLRGVNIIIECALQPSYRQNLRAVFFAINAMRMNEKRGISDTIRKAYLQLEAPPSERDPYEILGVRPDAPIEVIKAAHRALAKQLHSDVGGRDSDMKEANNALEVIEEERKGQ